jgi:hypothetical protein
MWKEENFTWEASTTEALTGMGELCTIKLYQMIQTTDDAESESYVTTDGQPASLSWNKAPIWGLRPDLDYCLTVTRLLRWGVLSDERTGLSFAIATGPR